MNFPIDHRFTNHHHSQSTIIDYGHFTNLQSAIVFQTEHLKCYATRRAYHNQAESTGDCLLGLPLWDDIQQLTRRNLTCTM